MHSGERPTYRGKSNDSRVNMSKIEVDNSITFSNNYIFSFIFFEYALLIIYNCMDRTDKEMMDIADRMLQEMEKEYWQVQQHNGSVECPEEEEHEHGGYQ